MDRRHDILGVGFDDITMPEAYQRFVAFLHGNSFKKVYTPNPEFLLNARKDSDFKDILNQGDLVLADGIGVILCARILGVPVQRRVRGVDFITEILYRSAADPFSVYLLGSTDENCKKAADNIISKYPNVMVLGYMNGYYPLSEEESVVNEISSLSPDLLLVALGSPRQEKFIAKYTEQFKDIKCAVGVGGTIDILSGNVRLAPSILRKTGLEWLYRLILEPKRIGRMIRLPLVLFYAFIKRIKK